MMGSADITPGNAIDSGGTNSIGHNNGNNSIKEYSTFSSKSSSHEGRRESTREYEAISIRDNAPSLGMDQLQVNEEYKIWKKNAPFLYDIVITHALEWPTLTVEWLPDTEYQREKGTIVQRLVLGTHTSGEEDNYLQLASVILPLEMNHQDTRTDASMDQELGGYGSAPDCRVLITQKILHDGEVNRARVMPQNPCLIATRTVKGPVHIWDYTKHPSKPKDSVIRPDLILNGHTREGYGLAWNCQRTGYLATCGEDQKVMVWDIAASGKDRTTLDPVVSFIDGHDEVIEDISWSYSISTVVSVGDDRKIISWDPRTGSSTFVISQGHAAEINCIAFSPCDEHLFVTGSADRTVAMWDIRRCSNVNERLHTFNIHVDDVLQVAWNPEQRNIFGSGGADRRLNVWDISRIGNEQSEEDAVDGPPELLFVHGGHTSKVSDFCWNPNDSWTICSSSEDNLIQIWKMSSEIYENDFSSDDELNDNSSDELGGNLQNMGDDQNSINPELSSIESTNNKTNTQESNGYHLQLERALSENPIQLRFKETLPQSTNQVYSTSMEDDQMQEPVVQQKDSIEQLIQSKESLPSEFISKFPEDGSVICSALERDKCFSEPNEDIPLSKKQAFLNDIE